MFRDGQWGAAMGREGGLRASEDALKGSRHP